MIIYSCKAWPGCRGEVKHDAASSKDAEVQSLAQYASSKQEGMPIRDLLPSIHVDQLAAIEVNMYTCPNYTLRMVNTPLQASWSIVL